MGFKVNTSFLRFLTMGAVGVRATIADLRRRGFEPIELERYCASNKIWMTKVKRLRLPDVLCVRTGLRFEVRAKSALKVRMSDAPGNPERGWDFGLSDEDVVAFVACEDTGSEVEVKGPPVYFLVRDLRDALPTTKLGSPKSASEGAERDREWKSTVPSQDGEVLDVNDTKIVVQMDSGRRQTYQLRDKTAYVKPGDRFTGGVSIIASTISRLAPLAGQSDRTWNPREMLTAPDPVDRYAAARAVPHRNLTRGEARSVLATAKANEADDRVALEIAASAARLGAGDGYGDVVTTARSHPRDDLRMEAVFILTELATPDAAAELRQIATTAAAPGDELRQAATWGLGKAGCRAYSELVDLLGDPEDAVALHAIAAFGPDAPQEVVCNLVDIVRHGEARHRAAAAEALKTIGSEGVIRALIEAARSDEGARPWVLATLGRLGASSVRAALGGDPLLAEVEPVLALGPTENWLATEATTEELRFLLAQKIV